MRISRDQIIAAANALPAAPQVLGGLCELLQDANTELDEIAEQIRVDSALAARVIRISNSAMFGGGWRVGSVDEAVKRVGFSEVLRLVGIATVARAVDRALVNYDIELDEMRESLLMHALAAEALARWTETDRGRAYTAGLLRGLGMMLLDRAAQGKVAAEERFSARRHVGYREWEEMTFGLCHTEAATVVMEKWRFVPDVVAGIRGQLCVGGPYEGNRLGCLLNLAGGIVAAAGRALPGEARAGFSRQRAALY